MKGKKFYVVVSHTYIAIVETVQELYDVLYFWSVTYCEVISVTSKEEATVLARQIYFARWAIYPTFFNVAPMSIPSTAPCYVVHPNADTLVSTYNNYASLTLNTPIGTLDNAITSYPVVQEVEAQPPANQPGPVAQFGAWAVVHLGGYAVEDDLNSLVCRLEEKPYTYAMWFPNPQTAALWALKYYVDTFCRFYDLRDVNLQRVPRLLEPGEEYNDPRFEDNAMEASDSVALKNLREHGLI